MNIDNRSPGGIIILADDSAEWRCAGLRQIDRLLLALNEYVSRLGRLGPVPVCVCSIGTKSTSISVENTRLPHVQVTQEIDEFCARRNQAEDPILLFSTHIVLDRMSELQTWPGPLFAVSVTELAAAVESGLPDLFERVRDAELRAWQPTTAEQALSQWNYLDNEEGIAVCEKWLLRGAAKPQDGFISRFINRPISRNVTPRLLRLPLLPNQLTLMLLMLPIAGAILLAQGNYLGFVLGAIFFQLHSALDGCDGEIARAKYLESTYGAKLDEICDRCATLIYVVGLGIGLYHQTGISQTTRWFYGSEAVITALVIGVVESLLTMTPIERRPDAPASDVDSYSGYATRHQRSFNPGDQLKLWVIRHSEMLSFGESFTSVFAQMTKRDVFNFGFLILALCGRASWILHILAATAAVILAIGLKGLIAGRLAPNRPVVGTD